MERTAIAHIVPAEENEEFDIVLMVKGGTLKTHRVKIELEFLTDASSGAQIVKYSQIGKYKGFKCGLEFR